MTRRRYRISVDEAVRLLRRNHPKTVKEMNRDKSLILLLEKDLILPFRDFDGTMRFVAMEHCTSAEKVWLPDEGAEP